MTPRMLRLATASIVLTLCSLPCRAEADSAKPVPPAPETGAPAKAVPAETAVDPEEAAKVQRSLAEILRAEDRREIDDALRAALKDVRSEVRQRAMLATGRIASPGTRALVEPGLKDAVPGVRADAAFALGLLLDPAAVPALEAAASDSSDLVRASVAEALGRIHTKETIRPITALLKDKSAAVKVEAALSAWQIPDATPVVTPLLLLLDSADHTTLLPASYALARLASAGSAPATSGSTPARPQAKDLRRIRDRLMALVNAPEAEVRMQVARGLQTPSTAQELSTLAALARDPDARVRVNAVRSLSYAGATIEPLLSRALKDADVRVTYTATEGLGKVGGPAAAQLLFTGLEKTKSPWLLEAAMTSIAAVAPSLVPQAALSLANHQVPAVRAAVAKALVGRPEPEALQIERAYLTDASSLVVVAAIPAVAAATENLGEGLETVAASEDPVVRAAVAEAAGGRLAKPGTGEAVRADALALLDKIWQRSGRDSLPDARIGVIDAAAMAGRDPLSHAILLKGLEDTDRVVRLRAIARLKSVFDEDASAKAGAASDRPLDEYLAILEWARKPRAAIVMVQRPGYDPGRFTLQLDASVAPLASWNFAKLAEKGYYDGLIVHRVVPNFVVQDGDPRGDGYGGPGYSIRDEIGHLRFAAGVLGMASDGKDTAGSQWFITLSAQPHLDGRYTAFGEVVQNLTGVVGQIQPGDRIVGIRMYEGNGTEPLPPL